MWFETFYNFLTRTLKKESKNDFDNNIIIPFPLRCLTSVLIIHNSYPIVINDIILSACNLPILNVTLGQAVIISDGRTRKTEAAIQLKGEFIRDLISLCDKI